MSADGTGVRRHLRKEDDRVTAREVFRLQLLNDVGVDRALVKLEATGFDLDGGRRPVIVIIGSGGDEVKTEVAAVCFRL